MPSLSARIASCSLGLLLWLAIVPVWGSPGLHLDTGPLEGPGWSAAGARIALEFMATGSTRASGRIFGLKLPAPLEKIRVIAFSCPALDWSDGYFCPAAKLKLHRSGGTWSPPQLAVHVDADTGLHIRGMGLAGGKLNLDLLARPKGWQVALHADGIVLSKLRRWLATWGLAEIPEFPTGRMSGKLELEQQVETLQGELRATLKNLAYSSEDGETAGENLDVELRLHGRQVKDGWQLAGNADLKAGVLGMEPVWVEVGDAPLAMQFKVGWRARSKTLELQQVHIQHPGIGVLSARASRVNDHWTLHQAELKQGHFPALYQSYLQPFLYGTPLAELETAGDVELRLLRDGDGELRAQIELRQVDLHDDQQRFGLEQLSGSLHWSSAGKVSKSALNWAGGHLYRAPLGPASLRGEFKGKSFQLSGPLEVQILDGPLRIAGFKAQGLGTPALAWELAGSLGPLSMERVSQVLDWPPFEGNLAGEIPAIRYAQGVMEVEGELGVQVFDGDMVIRDLRLEEPFGVVPRLRAEVDFRNLSLDALTRVFSFGTIRGRLDGAVHDLLLEDWQPRAFDARFATPLDDRSRHRISQRAVGNLSSLGGGPADILSRSFLRFFEDFSYQRLGLSCRLRRGLCEMGGVEDSPQGYYLVKGGGIPRIDVKGFNRKVDWNTLVERLKQATASQGPVVK